MSEPESRFLLWIRRLYKRLVERVELAIAAGGATILPLLDLSKTLSQGNVPRWTIVPGVLIGAGIAAFLVFALGVRKRSFALVIGLAYPGIVDQLVQKGGAVLKVVFGSGAPAAAILLVMLPVTAHAQECSASVAKATPDALFVRVSQNLADQSVSFRVMVDGRDNAVAAERLSQTCFKVAPPRGTQAVAVTVTTSALDNAPKVLEFTQPSGVVSLSAEDTLTSSFLRGLGLSALADSQMELQSAATQ